MGGDGVEVYGEGYADVVAGRHGFYGGSLLQNRNSIAGWILRRSDKHNEVELASGSRDPGPGS